MRVARHSASACSLGNSVLVFCGNSEGGKVNSVERLKVVPTRATLGAAWELIELPTDVFRIRTSPVVVPLDESKIAILGGGSYGRYLSDIVVFNITTN